MLILPCWHRISPLEIVFQEQSYSCLHSGLSLAWDHFRGDIDDPCGIIADFCGVIADQCGVIADPWLPVSLLDPWRDRRRCWSLRNSLNIRYGKSESGSPWEVQQFPRYIYKISGSRNVALDLLRSTEKSGSLAPLLPSHQKWWKACINICKHILKFSNCVLLRVWTNNNNYEQPIALFVIILAKTPSWINMVSFTVGTKSTRRSRPLLIKVGAKSTCQHHGCNIYYNKRRDLY